MWIFKYFICLIIRHNQVGTRYLYCLRCGKLEIGSDYNRGSYINEVDFTIHESITNE